MNLYRTLTGLRSPSVASTEVDLPEETAATTDPDEPPEQSRTRLPRPQFYTKAMPHLMARRESLLTRQLHSEAEHSEEEEQQQQQQHPTNSRPSVSGSIWSTNSVASTAELTSDDGRSVPSPAVSPPLAATYLKTLIPTHVKPLDKKLEIVDHDTAAQKDSSIEQTVEAGLGRRRCITFACGNKAEKAKPPSPTAAPSSSEQVVAATTSTSPKRKCMIQFACPSRPGPPKGPATSSHTKRAMSPPPPVSSGSYHERHTGMSVATKPHRGSDSTVTHGSPRSYRKSPAVALPETTSLHKRTPASTHVSSQDVDSDDSGPESTRFHEFATRDVEHEAWTQESTVHRSRLTISDTLKKENVIRRACEEVEEEAIEEDEDMDDLADENDLDDEDRDDGDDDVYRIDEESEDSDDGFHSDNEEGFADSDSEEGEDSDYEWWKPGGPSTAATSVEHVDRPSLAPKNDDDTLVSSLGSVSSGQMSPRSSRQRFLKRTAKKPRNTPSLAIPRPDTPELPDSTDFVAGTLDEDRPLEQAYINNMKDRAAAKHRTRPQDIDPTFPTSDPEIDDEDDEDLVDAQDSDREQMIHGEFDELDGDGTVKARRSPRPSRRNTNRSPAPPARLRSPPPPTRHHSPPPPKRRAQYPSPPPSRFVHNHSPRRLRSPAMSSRKTTPSNTRPGSPVKAPHAVSNDTFGLPQRLNVTHTASLPRGGPFRLSTMVPIHSDHEMESETTTSMSEAPKRGAIDIVKGLERKRQRRKEKLYQKLCAKAAAKGDKAYKVKPGKGAERMREVHPIHGRALQSRLHMPFPMIPLDSPSDST